MARTPDDEWKLEVLRAGEPVRCEAEQRARSLHDFGERKPDWLHQAASAMADATEQDWKSFRSAGEGA